jgi:hypothetical protein
VKNRQESGGIRMLKYVKNGVEFDDATYDPEIENTWSQICPYCVEKFNFDADALDEAGSGICGVVNCNNEADYYIDNITEVKDAE